MGYFRRQGDAPGVRTPVTFDDNDLDYYVGCGVTHQIDGTFTVYYGNRFTCPTAAMVPASNCPPKEVVLDFKITSRCKCLSVLDLGDSGYSPADQLYTPPLPSPDCTPMKCSVDWEQYDIAGIDCSDRFNTNCEGVEYTEFQEVVSYEELLDAVPTHIGQNNTGVFSTLVDFEPIDGLIDGTDCKCLFPYKIQTGYIDNQGNTVFKPLHKCSVSKETMRCLTSWDCDSNLHPKTNFPNEMGLLIYNYMLGVRKPIPCAEDDK